MRFPVLICFATITLCNILSSQQSQSLNGYVLSAKDREPLIGASVSVKGTKLGAKTNKLGYFAIKNVSSIPCTLIVSSIGFKKLELEVTEKLAIGQLNVELSPDIVSTREVVVSAKREEERREISISTVNIPVEQLKNIRIGGEADIFRSLQMLPGILTSSQVSSGLYVRGGSPDQNLVLLDGSTVYNPTHLFGFISAFNSEAIKDVELLKGGFPAEYGGRLSSVLNLTQKEGNRKEWMGLAAIGLISSRGTVEGPIGDGSFFLGARRTYMDIVLGALPADPENPFPDFNFYDINGKVTYPLGEDDKLSLSGFRSADVLILANPGITFQMDLGNTALASRWTHIFSKEVFSVTNLSWSRYSTGFDGDNSGFVIGVTNSIEDISLKHETEWYASNEQTFKAGFEVTRFKFGFEQNFSGKDTTAAQGTIGQAGLTNLLVNDWNASVFVQSNTQLSDLLSLQGGVRLSWWQLPDVVLADPRLSLRYYLTEDIALKASWGLYHQYLKLAALPDFSFFDTWLPTDNTVPVSKAFHYIIATESHPMDGYDLNVDFYYKPMLNTSEFNQLSFSDSVKSVNRVFFSGNSVAYGAEIFLQKKEGDFTGWIGYALGYVYSTFDSINQGREFRPKFDRRHDCKFVGQYKINERWEVGASFSFQSGQSYTGFTSRFEAEAPGDKVAIRVAIPSQRNGLRLPPSHQLNINAAYSSTLFGTPMRLLLDVFNVYNRKDIWFRFYNPVEAATTVTDVTLLPIIPTLSLELKF